MMRRHQNSCARISVNWKAWVSTLVVFATAVAWPIVAAAQSGETGFLNRSLVLDGVEYRYQVYVPREFRRSTRWPVILALHGGGSYGNDGLIQTIGGLADAIRRHPERVPAIVVFPQSHSDGTPGWQMKGGQAALAAADKAIAEFNGDRSRVYLTGYSAGGNGSWYLASRHAERFAAVVVVCGFISEFTGKTSGVHYPAVAPPSASDPFAAVAKMVSPLPVWIFHGDADKNVSVEESRHMFAALKAIGADVQYTEFPGVDHNAWDPAYGRADLFTWMFQQRRR
jgi:predicted peptidase